MPIIEQIFKETNLSLKDIELICINDGSTDNSLQILEEYAKNDDRIKIYSQKNQGQGAAKNYALTLFKGDYVMFLDQDDYMELNACEIAYSYITNYDVELVIFSARTFSKFPKNEAIEKHMQPYRYFVDLLYQKFNLMDLSNYMDFINISPWAKIYKKNLFENMYLKFITKVIYEDITFLMALIAQNPKSLIIKEILYNYNYPREGQVISSQKMDVLSIFDSYRYSEKIFKTMNCYQRVCLGFLGFRQNLF